MTAPRVLVLAGFLAGATIGVTAQAPKLDDVVRRMGSYLEAYGTRLALIVAEERYHQSFNSFASPMLVQPIPNHLERLLRSDYALTRAPDKEAWVGYRDTFEVDGKQIRDREDRLQRLLTSGEAASASRIVDESARFNLGSTIVSRNINVPTVVLEMLHPRNQWRFSFRKDAEENVGGTPAWRIQFRERERPTFIRDTNRRDRPSRGFVWVNPATGEVWRTSLTWDNDPQGTITVSYGHVANIDPLVPLTMSEWYSPKKATLTGEATYSNYRQFQTAARIVIP